MSEGCGGIRTAEGRSLRVVHRVPEGAGLLRNCF
jgi:hypothetical protein